MKTVLVLIVLALLAGCGTFGTSRYAVEPFVLDGRQTCCRIVIENGKEIGSLQARFKKSGDDWDITLKEEGVKAFQGQAITGAVISSTVGAVVPDIPLIKTAP